MTTTSDPNPLTTQRGAAPLTTVFTTPDFCKSLYWTNTETPPLSSIVCMPTSWKQATATTGSATMVAPHSPNPNAAQLDSTTVVEMETMERPVELQEDCIVELEGDMPGPPLYREKEGWPLR
ncbi:hypothetical protein CGMCC3_g11997 [Colletotrichum fructicola]|nr:uncharacterized protein CGMCC3_g11997 [Colletotrichum fructicola]KAE9571884.1 hypothetical protein CGMCC3_g11997 [Colletotrichum fructicola]